MFLTTSHRTQADTRHSSLANFSRRTQPHCPVFGSLGLPERDSLGHVVSCSPLTCAPSHLYSRVRTKKIKQRKHHLNSSIQSTERKEITKPKLRTFQTWTNENQTTRRKKSKTSRAAASLFRFLAPQSTLEDIQNISRNIRASRCA